MSRPNAVPRPTVSGCALCARIQKNRKSPHCFSCLNLPIHECGAVLRNLSISANKSEKENRKHKVTRICGFVKQFEFVAQFLICTKAAVVVTTKISRKWLHILEFLSHGCGKTSKKTCLLDLRILSPNQHTQSLAPSPHSPDKSWPRRAGLQLSAHHLRLRIAPIRAWHWPSGNTSECLARDDWACVHCESSFAHLG